MGGSGVQGIGDSGIRGGREIGASEHSILEVTSNLECSSVELLTCSYLPTSSESSFPLEHLPGE
jgi:hypothetical protein